MIRDEYTKITLDSIIGSGQNIKLNLIRVIRYLMLLEIEADKEPPDETVQNDPQQLEPLQRSCLPRSEHSLLAKNPNCQILKFQIFIFLDDSLVNVIKPKD